MPGTGPGMTVKVERECGRAAKRQIEPDWDNSNDFNDCTSTSRSRAFPAGKGPGGKGGKAAEFQNEPNWDNSNDFSRLRGRSPRY
jgi:hypothetical protein